MTSPTGAPGRTPNRLARERSPYLLQHALNPVDWHPWGDEAFERARREDKPVFLSIGYATCHWCHVMERESFEDEDVAALLNEHFVPVKVDREERPDVDRIYMTAMQATGMGGGWPLNVFLTPALEPFFGGTYFPKHSVPGRIGMLDLLPRVQQAWREDRGRIDDTGARILAAIGSMDEPSGGPADAGTLFESCFVALARTNDPDHGGFGHQPKFPSTVNLNFLVRQALHDPARREVALGMVAAQLDAMAAGGIHDHLGGGFHRYSVDREWLVPHFEKMLYDQAQIAWAYLEGYRLTGRERYAEVARAIFEYVRRDLAAPDGAFYSAEDADSEGEEGRFYVWHPDEIEALLGREDAALVSHRYGVTARGNFEHGATILSEVNPLEATARAHGLEPAAAQARLGAARATLLTARAKRPRPLRDDKVLAAWNGLMISALARGARVLGDDAYAARAAAAATFVWERLRDPATGALHRRWREGHAGVAGQLDDHAYVALGLLDLYAATHDGAWLERAMALAATMVARFWDERHGAFFETPGDDPTIRARLKEGFDGAEMAGNSIALLVLETLARLAGRRDWQDMARRMAAYYGARLSGGAAAMPQMLVAIELVHASPRHVVIAGDPAAADTRALVAVFESKLRPHDLLLLADGGAGQRRLAAIAPFVAGLARREGRATAYVCIDHACRLPVTDPAAFAALLDEPATATAARTPVP